MKIDDPPAIAEVPPTNKNFVTTKEYKRFCEFCLACKRDKYIGLCYGPPGVGKSISANAYTSWKEIEYLDKRWSWQESFEAPPTVRAYDSVLFTAPVVNSARILHKCVQTVCWKLSNLIDASCKSGGNSENDFTFHTKLIVIDEADRLKLDSLEEMRSIFDEGNVGLVLIGMPGIQKRLSRYPQLYSRVGFVHEFRTLSQEEIMFLIERHLTQQLELQDFTDKEALSAIVRISQGNFRLLMRLLEQIKRILEINKLQIITKEVVEAARENLVIGLL